MGKLGFCPSLCYQKSSALGTIRCWLRGFDLQPFSSLLSSLFDYFPLIVSPSVENPEGRQNEWQDSRTEMSPVP